MKIDFVSVCQICADINLKVVHFFGKFEQVELAGIWLIGHFTDHIPTTQKHLGLVLLT